MGACFKTAGLPAGAAAWSSAARRGYRGGGMGGGGGPAYDPDAAAYIAATGELFPEALNALVLGIKAAGLWDNHVGSIKKAMGVPSLAASMVDLRNPDFVGTPVNSPVHSSTEGWGFTAASSQYIDTGWQCGATDSKGSQDSVHVGWRIIAATAGYPGVVTDSSGGNRLGCYLMAAGIQRFSMNDDIAIQPSQNPHVSAGYIATRTGATARAAYKDGTLIGSDMQVSDTITALNMYIGARHINALPADNFFTGRIALWHAGAGLTAEQSATLTALFNAYCAAIVAAEP